MMSGGGGAQDRVRRERIDMHFHVGLTGDEYKLGAMSAYMRSTIAFKVFLAYGRVREDEVCDRVLREKTLHAIATCSLDRVVCLALDPVFDDAGRRREDLSNLWVDNDYVIDLGRAEPRVLLGASVHPYDPAFQERVRKYVDQGAVLLKWLPSAQQINLADRRVGDALRFLAAAGVGGKPLPLLLHCGVEYAIPTTDPSTFSYDFLSWSAWDRFGNFFRKPPHRWRVPDLAGISRNLDAALKEGAVIIFAHCGLPYFAPRYLKFAEHSDLDAVREYLQRAPTERNGRCYADVSAFCTPFRQTYFDDIRRLPAGRLVAGSDFPVPVLELSADAREVWEDFKAVTRGEFDRILIPQDNLLDVNDRELQHAFPGHPMFTTFVELL